MAEPVTRQSFRNAMARLGAAVTIVTTDGPGGRAGLTASAVCSVTDDPPTLLVCINRAASAAPAFRANGVLCVNLLSAAQQRLSNRFAGLEEARTMEERFALGQWRRGETGAPVLEGAVASLECRIADIVEKGTHSVFFAEVQSVAFGPEGPALVWWGRHYHPVGAP
ncbi:MAG: flavin reductase [Acetobacteraceae bacterium]|nr:flavin reductase [Acetobacteraceae bacterium]MCX7684159.1 flavin reductase [Acetobacteraceae bacterium]MDW8399222.1 flavin reductase [Acetobacteraceae bacterium]